MNYYRACGLNLRSDLALPSFGPGSADQAVEIAIGEGPVPLHLEQARLIGPGWYLGEDMLVLDIPGIVRMMIAKGRDLTYAIAPGASRNEAAIFVTGTGIGILLHQRRAIVLHASAVRVGDHAVLFCGPSGAGKSTIAAALGEEGFELIADDLCRIELRDTAPPLVHPDGRRLRLWEDATEGLGLSSRRGAAVREAIRKYYVEPRASSERPLPLAAIYALREARPPLAPGIHSPNSVDAALIVRHNAYRPLLVREMAQKQLYFHAAARIVRAARTYVLARALELDAIPATVAALGEQWRCLGLEKELAA